MHERNAFTQKLQTQQAEGQIYTEFRLDYTKQTCQLLFSVQSHLMLAESKSEY